MAFNKAKALQEAEKLVSQGKIRQAIKRYFDILERDSSDLSPLNTIGDLYIRDRNVSEGLKQFYRLAGAYVQDGFPIKAIAIYKKIVKLEPDSVDPLLKLIELYQTQKMPREARELHFQVAELYKRKKQNDKVLETLHKVVQSDVENTSARVRLAAFCEEIGRKEEAKQVYLETAQLAFRRGDLAAGQAASKKVQELDPDNPQTYLLRAREALATNHAEEVEGILNALPALKDDPSAQSLLIDSYLSTRQLEKAEKLVPDIFRANPTDFALIASFVSACVQVDEFDAAFRALSGLADELIKQGSTSSLLESLRLIWSKSPQHLPTLELIYRIYEEREDEHALPEILEALGHAYVQAGQLEKAEQTLQRLVSREPANERYKDLLNQVLKKQGKEVDKPVVAGLPSSASHLTQAEGAAAPENSAAVAEAERAAIVKQALDNSELFARYHLLKKAVAELDKVLEIYPDEPEIHRRLVGMCWKVIPERAEQAAQALVRIYTQQGDSEGVKKFASMAGEREAVGAEAIPSHAVHAPALGPESYPPPSVQPAVAAPWEVAHASRSSLRPVHAPESGAASAGPGFDLSKLASPASPPALTFGIQEIDLSEDWESFQAKAASPSLVPQIPQEIVPFNFEESRIEVNFYLESGFLEEAIKTVEELERTQPGEPRIAELRALVEAHTGPFGAEVSAQQPAETLKPTLGEGAASPAGGSVEQMGLASSSSAPQAGAQPAAMPPISSREKGTSTSASLSETTGAATNLPGHLVETPRVAPPFDFEESRIEVNFYLENGFLAEAMKAVQELERTHPGEPRITELRALVEAHKGNPKAAPHSVTTKAPTNPLGELADAFGPAIGELAEFSPPHAPPSSQAAGPATPPTPPTPAPASPLGGLLEEMDDTLATQPAAADDPETHYNLGVAFREMNLLDEAIGEFQKVVKGAGKSPHSPKYLQACSLLAICFMDKGMAPVAIQWYCRALETPDLDEEALLALQYDLGVAYEQAGDARRALEKFTEVYGHNIDFRDVAEKIRIFQQKGS